MHILYQYEKLNIIGPIKLNNDSGKYKSWFWSLELVKSEDGNSILQVCRDWKFHRDDVLKEVFEMCDKDGDDKLAGQ